MKSGISDYSEVLIYGLNKYFDITLLIDNYRLQNNKLYNDFNVFTYSPDMDLSNYDYKIYNIGNNPEFHSYIYETVLKYPGMIIMHDLILYYLIVGYYQSKQSLYSKIYSMEGAKGIHLIRKYIKNKTNLLHAKELSDKLALNKELLMSDNKFMVHSDYAYNNIISTVNDLKKVKKINMAEQIVDFKQIEKKILFKKFNIPENAFIFCSLGYVAPTKLNNIVCETLIKLREQYGNIFYIMAGEGNYCDRYLCDYIIKTGFIDLDLFNNFLYHSDVIVNLRNPSMGETSAVTIRSLGLGKTCIVSDDAWFSEISDDIVVKIKNNGISDKLYEKMELLITNKALSAQISQKAKDYINKEHSLEKISGEISGFLGKN